MNQSTLFKQNEGNTYELNLPKTPTNTPSLWNVKLELES